MHKPYLFILLKIILQPKFVCVKYFIDRNLYIYIGSVMRFDLIFNGFWSRQKNEISNKNDTALTLNQAEWKGLLLAKGKEKLFILY